MLKDEYKIYEEKMSKSIDSAAADFASVRAGRANAAVLDRITVDYTARRRPFSRSPRFPRRTPVFCKFPLGIIPR